LLFIQQQPAWVVLGYKLIALCYSSVYQNKNKHAAVVLKPSRSFPGRMG